VPVELVKRAQAGDEHAFDELAAQLLDRLYAVAYRILRNTARAEDATQVAVVTAWRKLPTLREPSRFEGWVHRILVNACRDELRRHRPDIALDAGGREAGFQADGTAAVEARDSLDRAFARLSAEHRIVLVLRHYLTWSTAEIATALELPQGTVSSRLHYAIDALRAALEADDRSSPRVPLESRP
jgi:RNA polymerase sigma-70 factor, ECF subfamily